MAQKKEDLTLRKKQWRCGGGGGGKGRWAVGATGEALGQGVLLPVWAQRVVWPACAHEAER
jgi:hypothetical protein